METENQMLKHGRSANHNEQKWKFFFFCKNQNTDLKKNSQNCKTENPNTIIDWDYLACWCEDNLYSFL